MIVLESLRAKPLAPDFPEGSLAGRFAFPERWTARSSPLAPLPRLFLRLGRGLPRKCVPQRPGATCLKGTLHDAERTARPLRRGPPYTLIVPAARERSATARKRRKVIEPGSMHIKSAPRRQPRVVPRADVICLPSKSPPRWHAHCCPAGARLADTTVSLRLARWQPR
jgi:hypothetical protein